jgi:hypothetical protein
MDDPIDYVRQGTALAVGGALLSGTPARCPQPRPLGLYEVQILHAFQRWRDLGEYAVDEAGGWDEQAGEEIERTA